MKYRFKYKKKERKISMQLQYDSISYYYSGSILRQMALAALCLLRP